MNKDEHDIEVLKSKGFFRIKKITTGVLKDTYKVQFINTDYYGVYVDGQFVRQK